MNVTEASRVLWEKGERILQGNRLGATDKEHVDALAFYMGLSGEEEHIVDMGCGFGEVSRLLAEKLPDAYFYLVNDNLFQLNKSPRGIRFRLLLEDMCDTGLGGDNCLADLVMFNWSLCHVDPVLALREAWRITKEDGRLFVYDYARMMGDNELTSEVLNARFIHDIEFRRICRNEISWMEVETIFPGGDDTIFRDAIGDPVLCDQILFSLKPVIWKATK